ncbi:sigma-70 family RNA polymerase sigma factor [Nocardia iowensis]|uniref:Sigma-70 family RNA polymerase sigma factor n=1 Tax=Nocardia iowensis TaxID=204891 RepID=A0ABX8S2E2_NOCIO|nr:sigma-70 family RNA polymerase sigma factor [Nocardia iowensis]QXN94725.1 sigma-70 family RNA polymerase sigma factor [Nocardia iowensis]
MTDDRDNPAGELKPVSAHDIKDAAFLAREVAAFSAFYRQIVPRLVAFLEGHGACRPDAVEIAQDTLEKAWRSWSVIEHPRTWSYTVAGREYARRMSKLEEDSVAEVPERTALLRSDSEFDAAERRHDLARIVPTLPSRQRQVMAWTLEGYEPREIAEILQITPEAARSNLKKARRTVAIYLDDSSEEQ